MSMAAPQIPPNGGGSEERRTSSGAGSSALERRERDVRRQGTLDRGARLARGLGWLSLGLGLAEIVAPRAVAKWIGVRAGSRHSKVIRAIGVREIVAGIGILTRPRPADWIWTRVGHDVTDLALLGSTLSGRRTRRRRIALATAAVAGVTLLDTLAGLDLGRNGDTATLRARRERAQQVAKAITIDCSQRTLTASGATSPTCRASWPTSSPCGRSTSEDRTGSPARRRGPRWSGTPRSSTIARGAHHLASAPGRKGGELWIGELPARARRARRRGPDLRRPLAPGGLIGAGIARLFGEAIDLHAASDLRRFKQLMEIGEVVQSDASIHRGPHAAQPPARPSSPPGQPRPSVSPSPEGAAR